MIADDAVTDGKIATGINAEKLANGTVTNAELQYINTLSSNAQTQIDAKTNDIAALNLLADGTVYLGDGSNVAQEVTLSGDVTIDNAGVSTIGASKVVTGMIADDAVTYAKIQNVSAQNRILGRVSPDPGSVEEIPTTGSDNVVRATSPTLVTPVLGVATATSITTGEIIDSGTIIDRINTTGGNVTINSMSGRFRVLANDPSSTNAKTVVITNTLVTTNSIIVCTSASNNVNVAVIHVIANLGNFNVTISNSRDVLDINFLVIN